MKVHFYSKALDHELDFYSNAIKENDFIKFKDESLVNTEISLKKENESLVFKRTGDTFMDVIFKKGQKNIGKYKSTNGLEFDFEVDTKYLYFEDEKIEFAYYLYIDGELNNIVKIIVSFN